MKNLLLTALLGTTIVVNAFALPPKVDMCTGSTYDARNGYCEHCPSNYNNSGEKFSIEECCIDELTYDSESGLCVAVASNEPNNAPARINTNNADCDNETLGTYTGPTTLAAQWNPNIINLNWYTDSAANGGTTINVANTNAASCEYDGGITLPDTPNKPGYHFAGWRVRNVSD